MHVEDDNPNTYALNVVTASVENTRILGTFPNIDDGFHDLVMTGQITWVGGSSILVRVTLESDKNLK